jgi:hypothetical protein
MRVSVGKETKSEIEEESVDLRLKTHIEMNRRDVGAMRNAVHDPALHEQLVCWMLVLNCFRHDAESAPGY